MLNFRINLLLVVLMLLGIAALPAASVTATPSAQATVTYRVREALYNGRQVYYYIFENGTPVLDDGAAVATARQYRLVNADGAPIPGQWDIIAHDAWQDGYSDLREIVEVIAPEDYEANTITSVEALQAQDWPMTPTGQLRNIPLARPNSQLQGRDKTPVSLWLDGEELAAYDFGPNPAQAAPIYVLVSGFDDEGNAIEIDHPALIEHMHADAGYSDFWQVIFVTVPDDVEPYSIRSVEALREAGYEFTPTANVVNCPAIRLEDMAVAYHDGQPYNITHIIQSDLEPVADGPRLYTYVDDNGHRLPDTPLVLDTGESAASYTGRCGVVHVPAEVVVYLRADVLLDDSQAALNVQETVSTCAYLSPYAG